MKLSHVFFFDSAVLPPHTFFGHEIRVEKRRVQQIHKGAAAQRKHAVTRFETSVQIK